MDSVNPPPSVIYLSGVPKNETVYRFIPGDISAAKQENLIEFNFYPNPFDKYLTVQISSNKMQGALMEIYNQLGEIVKIQSVNAPGETRVLTDAWVPGLYFYRLLREGEVLARGKIIAN